MPRLIFACLVFLAGVSVVHAQFDDGFYGSRYREPDPKWPVSDDGITEDEFREMAALMPIFRGVPVSLTHFDEEENAEPAESAEKTYLLLGQNETLHEGAYHFEMRFGEEAALYYSGDDPLSGPINPVTSEFFPHKLYRPVWKLNDQVLICRFDFKPIRFTPVSKGQAEPDAFQEKDEAAPMAPIPSYPEPVSIKSMSLRITVNGKSDDFTLHASRDGEKWYPVSDRRAFGRLFPTEAVYLRIAAPRLGSVALSVDARLNVLGGNGTGDTLLAKSLDDEPSKELLWQTVFRDEVGDLCMIVENKGDEVFQPLFGLGHITDIMCSDGGFQCLPVPAQSAGVLRFSCPGHGTVTIGSTGFGLQYSFRDRSVRWGQQIYRYKEPDDDFTTFQDTFPEPVLFRPREPRFRRSVTNW